MTAPSEHKTVQSSILASTKAIGWTIASREEAEQRRKFDPAVPPADRAKNRTLFFDDLLDTKVRRDIFNWKDEEVGKLEAKVKSFCAIPQVDD